MIALCYECGIIYSETPIFVGVSAKSTVERDILINKDQHKKILNINQNLAPKGFKDSQNWFSIDIFIEAIMKHPYKRKFWTSNLLEA